MSSLSDQKWSGDEGIAMILVLGIMGLVTILVGTALTIGVNALGSSRTRTSYEQAAHVAEAGLDFGIAQVQSAMENYQSDVAIPGDAPSPCSGTSISLPTFASASAEAQWAWTKLQALSTSTDAACVRTSDTGQYVILKPPSVLRNGLPRSGVIYSLGAIPSFSAPKHTLRLLKNEYAFVAYKPGFAILASGALSISSSTTVTEAPAITANSAAVHSNSTVTVAGGNPTVSGLVSSTNGSSGTSNKFASNPGGAVAHKSEQPLPVISAALAYSLNVSDAVANGTTWYNLCPGGAIYQPTANSSGTYYAPCSNSNIPVSTSASTLGLTWCPANASCGSGSGSSKPVDRWIIERTAADGVYFASHANVETGSGNRTFNRLSVLAEKLNWGAGSCASNQAGDISWDHFAISAPALPGLFFLADGDMTTTSNFTAGSAGPPAVSGQFLAGDQISLYTSSQGAYGSVVAHDYCSTDPLVASDEIKNPTVYFDPSASSPFSLVLDSTQYLDLVN